MLCDQCIASQDARFALTETGLGMIPGVGGTQTLSRLLGVTRALDAVLTGDGLDARAAQRLGLVARAVDPARLLGAPLPVASHSARVKTPLFAHTNRSTGVRHDTSPSPSIW